MEKILKLVSALLLTPSELRTLAWEPLQAGPPSRLAPPLLYSGLFSQSEDATKVQPGVKLPV